MDNTNWSEKRTYPRVSWNFVMKCRSYENRDFANWEVVIVQNISKTGCYFFSQTAYKAGEILDIEIQFPNLAVPMEFTGEVKRCVENSGRNLPKYGIGIYFTGVDEDKKNIFDQTLDFFLKKKRKIDES